MYSRHESIEISIGLDLEVDLRYTQIYLNPQSNITRYSIYCPQTHHGI